MTPVFTIYFVEFAGILPDGATAVSAIGLAFNIYGTLFMAFLGVAVAVGTRVGNSLGANRPGSARLSALTAVSVTPLIWLPLGVLLTLPYTQSKLVGIFVRPEDTLLWDTLGYLLNIVAMLELFDGLQTVMSGKHTRCMYVYKSRDDRDSDPSRSVLQL